jgi:beta-glucanase (GH16 family)
MIAALCSRLGCSAAVVVLVALPLAAHAQSSNAPSPKASQAFTADREKPGFELVKEWDFSASAKKLPALLDDFSTLYAFDNGRQDYLPATGEWERYRLNHNHVLEDGALKLVARAVNWTPGGFESGMIRSKLSQRYGYFEITAKMPRGRGMWPSITLQPTDAVWPPSIVIASTVGNHDGTLRTSYHLIAGKDVGPDRDSKIDQWGGYENAQDLSDGYHVFAVDWTPQGVTHYVDGVAVVKRNFAWKHDNGKDAGPAQLVITLAVGGDWAGPPINASDFPAEMAIKDIRVYRHVSNQLVELPTK